MVLANYLSVVVVLVIVVVVVVLVSPLAVLDAPLNYMLLVLLNGKTRRNEDRNLNGCYRYGGIRDGGGGLCSTFETTRRNKRVIVVC